MGTLSIIIIYPNLVILYTWTIGVIGLEKMKDKNSSNNVELSVRERMELDKEIRMVGVEIRKKHPYDWREILK